jgi:hypothetical protein
MLYTSISLHNDAALDLEHLKQDDLDTAAKILALLRQLRADPHAANNLLDHGFGDDGDEDYSVNKWINLWKKGIDLWRLKDWDLEDMGIRYRLIYLFKSPSEFILMAVVKREELDYDDPNHPIRIRILTSLRTDYGIK